MAMSAKKGAVEPGTDAETQWLRGKSATGTLVPFCPFSILFVRLGLLTFFSYATAASTSDAVAAVACIGDCSVVSLAVLILVLHSGNCQNLYNANANHFSVHALDFDCNAFFCSKHWVMDTILLTQHFLKSLKT